jgi:predicted phage terminase large subunit-like protein
MFQVPSAPFHHELSRLCIDPDITKLSIIAPRGHAKSSVVGCLAVIHHLMYQPGPHLVVLVSKTVGHAVKLLDTIKNILDYSRNFRTVFGYWGEHSAKVWRNDEIVLKNGSAIMCRGTGQQVVGLKVDNQRPTLIILDDPEDMTNTKTAEAMDYNLRWMLQSLAPSRDPQRGKIIIVGTPQHQECMVEKLHKADGWSSVRYQAILSDDETRWKVGPGQPDVLWPEWNPLTNLLKEFDSMKSMGKASSFYREYQCQVIGDEDQLFKESYLQYHDYKFVFRGGETFLENGEDIKPVRIFLGIDPASSVSQTADFSVIMPLAVDADRNFYVLPFFRKRVTPMELAQAIIKYFHIYHPHRVTIESVGYQEMLRSYLRSIQDLYIPGLESKVQPRTSKSSRLETMHPYFYQGRVFLTREQDALKDELLSYPRGSHDDCLDGLYYAFMYHSTPTHDVPKAAYIPKKNIEGYLLGTAQTKDKDWMLA